MSLVPFNEWLRRKPAGPKPRNRIDRKTRLKRGTKPLARTSIRRVSQKHGKELKRYLRARKEYLTTNYACEAAPVILKAKLPPSYTLPTCTIIATEVHHTAGRGPNLCKVEAFCAICRNCHEWLHSHAQAARSLGLLA